MQSNLHTNFKRINMEATKFLSSTLPSHSPEISSLSARRKKTKELSIVFMAANGRESRNYGGDYTGRIVDDNMIVLRMRIRENKMLETTNEPPSDWMEWEKKYYANNGYNEDICEALGFLQNYLLSVRPGLAIGLIALVALSLVLSTGFLLFHTLQIVRIIMLSGI